MLNPVHPVAGAKARGFMEMLGIGREDWVFRRNQLLSGLRGARPFDRRPTPEGVTYGVYISVKGRNGNVREVRTAWEIKGNEPPRLVTAYLESWERRAYPRGNG